MTPIESAKIKILQRVPLTDLVGQHMTLTRRSGRSVGLCPFHGEKSPSFTIYDDRYFCFGCRATGDAIDFVRHVLGLGFMDALKYLAEKFQVDAPELESSSQWKQQGEKKSNLFRHMVAAQDFFVTVLRNPANQSIRQYLLKRGFTEEQVAKYGFGFAPGTSDLSDHNGFANAQLSHHLLKLGANEDELLATSLSWQGKRQLFDFFRGRLTIPIQDAQGRVVGFGGRTLRDEQPKYLNSRDTVLFDKGRVLFGLYQAKPAIREKRRAILVEGYMDTLKLWAKGVDETVACLGTAITTAHLRLIEPLANTVILLLDGDAAGQKASLRAVTTAIEVPHVDVRVCALPAGLDPDEFVEKHGVEALQNLLRESVPIFEYAVKQTLKGLGKLEVPKVVKEQFVPWLSVMTDPIQRSFLVAKVAQWTGVNQKTIESEMASDSDVAAVKEIKEQEHVASLQAKAKTGGALEYKMVQVRSLTSLEFEVLGHLYFAAPSEVTVDDWLQRLEKTVAWDDPWNELFGSLSQALSTGLRPADAEIEKKLGDAHPKLFEVLEKFRSMSEAFACNDRPKRLGRLLRELRGKQLRETVTRLRLELQTLGPEAKAEAGVLVKAIQELNAEMSRV